jgi:hypothetical protein
MDGPVNRASAHIPKKAALPAWFPTVTGGSAWWLPAGGHQRAAANDRRKSRRCAPVPGAMALLRPVDARVPDIAQMHMGAIAMAVLKTNPTRMGRIKDISMTGLAFFYADSRACSGQPCRLDILLAEKGFYLKDIDYQVITDRPPTEDDFATRDIGQLSVCFNNLDARQRRHLSHFLAAHTQGTS